ncbi:NRDE family protein [Flavobacterium sp. J27]|uniref:NRDE family protein n=1 Tax=Flavobacterium sp. J27 TaxID=2060419 RepID=UPI00102FB17E|nr:NRDE family protein [Flavobacterium sp. J27]
MCTVTYVPLSTGYCLTSNRDEQIARPRAIPPKEYTINNYKITFPKDQKGGGTWFAKSNTATVVLLNGAQEKHIPKAHYRKSRGLIVIDLIASPNVLETWQTISLEGIEPFTIVLFENKKLHQLQWDGVAKSDIELDTNKAYIWSSSTLYSKEIRAERSQWFFNFLEETTSITAEKLCHFHQFTENENTEFGLQINRNNILKTVSITQVVDHLEKNEIHYIDLLES